MGSQDPLHWKPHNITALHGFHKQHTVVVYTKHKLKNNLRKINSYNKNIYGVILICTVKSIFGSQGVLFHGNWVQRAQKVADPSQNKVNDLNLTAHFYFNWHRFRSPYGSGSADEETFRPIACKLSHTV